MGWLNRKQQVPPTIKAAVGKPIRGGHPASAESIVTSRADWQKQVLALADSVPEAASAGAFINNALDRVIFEVEGVPEDKAAIINRQLRGIPAGRMGENLFFVGEVYASFQYIDDESRTEWCSLGTDDYKSEKNKPFMVRGESGKFVVPPEDQKVFRVWRHDKSNWRRAWSPHKALLDLMRAMYLAQLADTAISTSRLASSGILFLPASLPSVPVTDGGEPEPGTQEAFMQMLADAMEQQVRQSDPMTAVTPIMYFGEPEDVQAFKHLVLERRDDAEGFASRMASYRKRYATGVDLPPEIVEGMGGANHWSAWKVDQNTWTYYLAPLAQLIADAILRTFVIPLARNMQIPTEDLRISVNGKKVIAKPDKTDAAIRLGQMGFLKKEAVVARSGFEVDEVEPIDYEPMRKESLELPVSYKDQTPMSTNPSVRQAAVMAPPDMQAFTRKLQETEDKLSNRVETAWKRAFRKEQKSESTEDELSAVEFAVVAAITARLIAAAHAAGVPSNFVLNSNKALIDARARLATQRFAEALTPAAGANRKAMPATLPTLVSSIAAGGLNSLDGVTIVGDIADIGTDQLIRETLDNAGIEHVVNYRWVRGEPNHPFPPHVLLEGQEWTSTEAPAFLTANAWVAGGSWHPGDHAGCQCRYYVSYELKT